MAVYVDHAFAYGEWGRWSGGGHLQADTAQELHAFAAQLGLVRAWFQSTPGRPEKDHYDLTDAGRRLAIGQGAIPEDRRTGVHRRRAARNARHAGAGRSGVGDRPPDHEHLAQLGIERAVAGVGRDPERVERL